MNTNLQDFLLHTVSTVSVVRKWVLAHLVWFRTIAIVLVVFASIGYVLFFQPPAAFTHSVLVHIPEGYTARQAAAALVEKRVIASPELFIALVRVFGEHSGVHAGEYRFNKPAGLVYVVRRLLAGDLGIEPVHIMFKEGVTVHEMASMLAARFMNISSSSFQSAAASYEGYLFPDTYSFLPDVTEQTVINTMRKNFDVRTASITPEIQASGHSLKDIVIMASLIEKEARTIKNRRIIAGILWHRLRAGMPLQVDAVFGYISGKQTYSPSLDDLKIKSPYNTYLHKGLPPGPIDNPGFESLLAAMTPISTPYLYYLTGKDGRMHYATTLAGHNRNSAKYLR